MCRAEKGTHGRSLGSASRTHHHFADAPHYSDRLGHRGLADREGGQDTGRRPLARYNTDPRLRPATTQSRPRFSSDPEYELIRGAENSAEPCDIGTAVPNVADEFPNVDYSTLDPIWPDKTSQAASAYHYTRTAIIARGQAALQRLYERPEKIILAVSHSGFLRLGVTGCWFFNADYRVFDFAPRGSPESPYRLEQHASTEEKGGGLGHSWTEQVQLGLDLPEEFPEPE